MSLLTLRNRIDALDQKLVDLLNDRARAAAQIGRLKQKMTAPVFVPAREREVLRRVRDRNRGPLNPEALEAIYREIISASRALERRLGVGANHPAALRSQCLAETDLASVEKVVLHLYAGGAVGPVTGGVTAIELTTHARVSR